jgi:ribosomal protein S18 acetylase RimI-like enzyme
MVRWLQDKYSMTIEAETDDEAVEFYRKCGFETTSFYEEDGDERYKRWTCVLPIDTAHGQETDEERRARI